MLLVVTTVILACYPKPSVALGSGLQQFLWRSFHVSARPATAPGFQHRACLWLTISRGFLTFLSPSGPDPERRGPVCV